MSQSADSLASTDRNLLFGIVALQMNLVTKDDLISAMNTWIQHKERSLAQILHEHGALRDQDKTVVEQLVAKHVDRHEGKAEITYSTLPAHHHDRGAQHQQTEGAPHHLAGHVPPTLMAPSATGAPVRHSVGSPTSSGYRFQVLRQYARGGLGAINVARDIELNREVALKEILEKHADDKESRARFLLEAEITGGLEHPGIVPVYGLGIYPDGRPYYAMRFIRGEDLRSAIQNYREMTDGPTKSVEFRKLLNRFLGICNAMAYAHSRGVIHRDLKPANVMLGVFGETFVVDWGLAKPIELRSAQNSSDDTLKLSELSSTSTTLDGAVVGTPHYMSPEQAAGKVDELGPTSDIYSLGAILFSILTGKAPIESTDIFDVLEKVERGQLPTPRSINPAIDPALEAICVKAMALQPNDRYHTATALASDVEHWLADEPVTAYVEPWTRRASRWARRHQTMVVASGLVMLTALVGSSVAAILIGQEQQKTRKEYVRAEANFQKAEANFKLARKAVDEMLTEVGESDLAEVPQAEPVRKRLLARALDYYQGFLASRSDDAMVITDNGKAISRLANVQELLGEFRDAEQSYRQAIAVLGEAGGAAMPADYKDDLGRCWVNLGVLLKNGNRFGEAEEAMQKGLQLREERARASTDAIDRQRAWADGLYQLGALLARIKDRRPDAEKSYRHALQIQQDLIKTEPAQAPLQRELARTWNNLGNLLSTTDPVKAEDAFNSAIRLQKALIQKHPGISAYQRELARTYSNLATSLTRSSIPQRAEEAYQQSLQIFRKLAAEFPSVPDYRRELGNVLYNLALFQKGQNRMGEAETLLLEGRDVLQRLVSDFKDIPEYRHSLGVLLVLLASTWEDTGRKTEAERGYEAARQLQLDLVEHYPQAPLYASTLGGTCNTLALLWSDRADAIETRQPLLLAGEIGLHKPLPVLTNLAVLYSVRLAEKPIRQALSYVDQAIPYQTRAVKADPPNRRYREFVRNDIFLRTRLLLRLFDHAAAAQQIESLVQVFPADWSADARDEYIRAAQLLATCVALVDYDTTLNDLGKKDRRDVYGHRAVELLREAARLKVFKANILDQPLFAPLSGRADFRKLKQELVEKEKQGVG